MTNSQLQLLPTAIKPPIKWVGGKRQFLPKIARLFEQSGATTLIEPFFGGGSVTLGLRPRRAIANDLNSHLINFWRQCREKVFLTYPSRKFYQTNFSGEKGYYTVRQIFNELIKHDVFEEDLAFAFYYLLKNCHGGVCRFNQRGEFNTPYGNYPSVNYEYDWATLADALKYVELNNWHWQDFFAASFNSLSNAMVFADPPYHQTFKGYNGSGFSWEEQVNLSCYLSRLQCPVIATNSWTDKIVEMYQFNGFTVEKVERSGGHGSAFEMFATKNF